MTAGAGEPRARKMGPELKRDRKRLIDRLSERFGRDRKTDNGAVTGSFFSMNRARRRNNLCTALAGH